METINADRYRVQIGSVSHGTMRDEDLLDTFADVLRPLAIRAGNEAHGELCDEADRIWEVLNETRHASAEEIENAPEEAADVVQELFDALGKYAPTYCQFGAHEGDGSDYGFWPDDDAMSMAVSDGEAIKVSDLSEVPADWRGVVVLVNDHGNVTVYEPVTVWREVWSCV
jgi:hypothetical protein